MKGRVLYGDNEGGAETNHKHLKGIRQQQQQQQTRMYIGGAVVSGEGCGFDYQVWDVFVARFLFSPQTLQGSLQVHRLQTIVQTQAREVSRTLFVCVTLR